MTDHTELKRLAEAATPQKFDTAEEKSENGYIECPHCGGSGEVELEADYCNYDGVAIGVQFYGIGHEFGAAEAYYRAANPAAIRALIAENERLRHALQAIITQVDGNIRPSVRDCVNGQNNVQDIYGYCDQIESIAAAAMKEQQP